MNIIDILVLLVLAFSLFAGMYKGFLASGLSLLGLVGSWFGALRLYPAVARLALENQTLMGVLSNYLEPATFFEDMAISGVSAPFFVGCHSAASSGYSVARSLKPGSTARLAQKGQPFP